MRTLHFVYATPQRLVDKVSLRFLKRKVTHPGWERYRWPSPIHAPLCITYHLARQLAPHFRVKLYDLSERVEIRPQHGDILLGHMCADPQSVMWRALDNPKFARKYLISPYNHDPSQILFLDGALAKCDRFFALCGQYWIDTFERSPLAKHLPKFVRVNMGIDLAQYPLVKQRFSPPGQRKFFYVGRVGQEKGVDRLEMLARDLPGFHGGYISQRGEIAGWHKISEPRRLTPEFMREVARDYDIFINLSRADAQVTTVLEAMCWGFPVVCTRESGYSEEPTLFLVDADDETALSGTLQQLQEMDDARLGEIAALNRRLVAQKYNWEQFVATVYDRIAQDLACGGGSPLPRAAAPGGVAAPGPQPGGKKDHGGAEVREDI